MSAIAVEEVVSSSKDEGQWAVETHGLTKRFKDNVAVDGGGAPGASWLRLRLPRAERCRQDDPHPGAPGPDPRRCRDDVPPWLPGPPTPRSGTGPDGRHRRRAPVPWPPHRQAEPRDPGRGPRAGGPDPHRVVARAGGHRPARRRQGVQVLHGHAPAPGRRRLPARGSRSCSSSTSR